jgi:threonine dehydrogenase-like Zn-dependent dehydrogenase
MKAVQIQAPGRVAIVEVPVPEVAADEVLVKVECCVTCPQWDLTLYAGVDIFSRPGYPRYPIPWGYPGHEMAGQVVRLGSEVESLQVGDRVAALVTAGETVPGYYCEFINRPADTLIKLPDEVSYEAGANMEMCRHMMPFVRLLGEVAGKRTGVTGVGPAGLIALQFLKARGAAEVVAIDLLPERLELARQLGATETVNSATEEIETLQSKPLQATVDCSGVAAGLQTALDYTRGSISVFGVPHGEVKYGIRHWGSNLLSGSGPVLPADDQFVLEAWRSGQLNTEALVTAKLPFERYVEGIEMLKARQAIKIGFYPG